MFDFYPICVYQKALRKIHVFFKSARNLRGLQGKHVTGTPHGFR